MIARLYGKANIYNFKIEIFGDIKAHDFLKVTHPEVGDVLCQVQDIIRDADRLIGECKIIGYREAGVLKNIRTPFPADSTVDIADDNFIEDTVGLSRDSDAFLGILEHHPDLRINLDLKKTITKHVAVLAKSGAGKSYTVGVLLEEIMKKNIPLLIIDPHNEYGTMKYPNSDKKDLKRLEMFGLEPKGFLDNIKEFSPDTTMNPQARPATLDINKMHPQDLMESLPQKLTPSQQNILYNVLSSVGNRVDFDELIFNISNEESSSKWSLINLLEQLKKLKLYSSNPTKLDEIVANRTASFFSLKGVEPFVQDLFVSGLLKDLFEARKKEEIPPFFLVLEEAHNYCPERSFGETKSSKIIRTLASEGRKFGIGLCVVSQRPAKVDKNVLSQCGTQLILKITNPNDLKSVISSSEGVDSTSEKEIQRLNIGTGLVTGLIDIPLKVNIRPRLSKHGGETVDITLPYEVEKGESTPQQESSHSEEESEPSSSPFEEESHETSSQQESSGEERDVPSQGEKGESSSQNSEFVQYVAPEIEKDDAKSLLDTKQVEVDLVPAAFVKLNSRKSGEEVTLLVDKVEGNIIKRIVPLDAEKIGTSISNLSQSEKKLLESIMELNDRFNPAELLLKSDVTFGEILRICDSLASKGLLKKHDRDFELTGAKFAKDVENLHFYGGEKFEDVSYDKKVEEKLSSEDLKSILSIAGEVENVKDTYILRYVAND